MPNTGHFWTEDELRDLPVLPEAEFLTLYPKISREAYRQKWGRMKLPEVEQARRPAPGYPKGWEPGVVWNGYTGEVTGPTTERPKDWNDLITSMGLDPAEVEVVEPVQMRWWDAAVGNGETRRHYYAKANIRRRRGTGFDIEELLQHVKPGASVHRTYTGSNAYVFGIADPQCGKLGTGPAVDRVVAGIEHSAQRLKTLRKKRNIGATYIPCLGDLVENCAGHYPMQEHTTELDGREQARLARRLLVYAIEEHRGLTERVIVPAVAGNHGEKRNGDGKSFTTFGDNIDLEIPENVAESYEMAGATDVSFVIPDQTLTLTLDIGGLIVGMIHGHQAQRTRGGNPPEKVRNWWSDQMLGRRPVTDADILLNGHFHQHWINSIGRRYSIGFPTADSGSQWWDETRGTPTHSGMLSLVIGKDYPLGFGDWDFT